MQLISTNYWQQPLNAYRLVSVAIAELASSQTLTVRGFSRVDTF